MAQKTDDLLRFKKKIDSFLKDQDGGDLNSIRDILKLLGDANVTVKDLEMTEVGFSLKRLKAGCNDSEVQKLSKSVTKKWKKLVKAELAQEAPRSSKRARGNQVSYKEPSDTVRMSDSKEFKEAEMEVEDNTEDGSSSSYLTVKAYKNRLVRDHKELYKDPPVLPPLDCFETVSISTGEVVVPRREKKTGEFHFKDFPKFTPNLSPKEVLEKGSFGGSYFRTIKSAVLNRTIQSKEALESTLPEEWIKGLDKKRMLTSSQYSNHVNNFKVKCGGSLGMWESSGWISDIDPYGWFQWYCRFFQGRRCSDDERQISRALKCMGPTGRFRVQLMNKIINAKTTHDDRKISPVIRQSLQHWGYYVSEGDLQKYKKKKGLS